MKYKNGYLTLSDVEAEQLSYMFMTKVELQHHASSFVGEMAEIKSWLGEKLTELESKDIRSYRDQLIIDITQLMIEYCDVMIEKGFDAAKAAGETIKPQ